MRTGNMSHYIFHVVVFSHRNDELDYHWKWFNTTLHPNTSISKGTNSADRTRNFGNIYTWRWPCIPSFTVVYHKCECCLLQILVLSKTNQPTYWWLLYTPFTLICWILKISFRNQLCPCTQINNRTFWNCSVKKNIKTDRGRTISET